MSGRVIPRHLGSRVSAALLACAMAFMAQAGNFQLTPIYGEVAPGQSVLTYTITNGGDTPIVVQIDAMAWEQDPASGDRELPTTALVIAPRMLTVAPGERRPARIALRDRNRNREAAFRVTVKEVPAPPVPGATQLRTIVAQNVPLVFTVAGEPGPLDWQARLQPDGRLHLQVGNPGARFLRVVDIAIVDPRGAILAERDGGAYVLAGQTVGWTLATPARLEKGTPARLQYDLGGRRVEVPLTIE
jgi:fimbrial chaperone protein